MIQEHWVYSIFTLNAFQFTNWRLWTDYYFVCHLSSHGWYFILVIANQLLLRSICLTSAHRIQMYTVISNRGQVENWSYSCLVFELMYDISIYFFFSVNRSENKLVWQQPFCSIFDTWFISAWQIWKWAIFRLNTCSFDWLIKFIIKINILKLLDNTIYRTYLLFLSL